jgi:hypothetical protein
MNDHGMIDAAEADKCNGRVLTVIFESIVEDAARRRAKGGKAPGPGRAPFMFTWTSSRSSSRTNAAPHPGELRQRSAGCATLAPRLKSRRYWGEAVSRRQHGNN